MARYFLLVFLSFHSCCTVSFFSSPSTSKKSSLYCIQTKVKHFSLAGVSSGFHHYVVRHDAFLNDLLAIFIVSVGKRLSQERSSEQSAQIKPFLQPLLLHHWHQRTYCGFSTFLELYRPSILSNLDISCQPNRSLDFRPSCLLRISTQVTVFSE